MSIPYLPSSLPLSSSTPSIKFITYSFIFDFVTHIYTITPTHTHPSTHNLFSLISVALFAWFRAHPLGLGSKKEKKALNIDFSASFGIHWLPVAFHLGVGSFEIFPSLHWLVIWCGLCRSCGGSHVAEILWVYLLTSLGESLMTNSSVLWLFILMVQWAFVASHSFFTGILFHNRESWTWFWLLFVPQRGKMTWVEVRGHANEWLAQTLLTIFPQYRHTQIRKHCLGLQHPWRCHRSCA